MKKVNRILAITILLFTLSCSEKVACGECFTPPLPFQFELVDKLTGENLFSNGTFNSGDIEVLNIENQSNIEFAFIEENDYDMIVINTIGWKTEIVNYSIRVSSENIFELFVIAERLSGECCSYTEYTEIRIENSDFELDQDSGIYKIFVE
jgi:hypothetical protein